MTKDLSWTTDNGLLRGFPYHDGSLLSVSLLDGRQEFTLENTAGNTIGIYLTGVSMFSVSDYWNGAILLDIFLWRLKDTQDSLWEVNDSAWMTLLSSRMNKADAIKYASKLKLSSPDMLLVQLGCIGGNFATVCSAFEAKQIR